ncbi:hypothetical protein HPB52_013068 [Rhipicephalus sanguineus]|uniref:Uncharacterized protein n=1 Tax=Rhipicephalus sanguineus TaxID=34632 RepID=A0A9D4TA31_RHISA|nr:hypothetical protein HPB52_013068 [Rhipicephalus sanguineus]
MVCAFGSLVHVAVGQPMDLGIVETTRKLYHKVLLQRALTAYDASKRHNIYLLGVIHLLNFSWKELAPSKVANCSAHANFLAPSSATLLDDDRTWSNLCEAVRKIAGQEVEGSFEMFALADAAASVVAPATDAEIVDPVGGPDEDAQPHEMPTTVQTREYLLLL